VEFKSIRMYIIENKLTPDLIEFLKKNDIVSDDENVISIEKPGEGNMNLVLRIITNERSIILKQSRAFVNKYPQIDAPIERILVETEFYKTISSDKNISSHMPKMLGFYPDNFLLVLEDLGKNSDYTSIYEENSEISENEIIALTAYLSDLHSIKIQNYPSNQALKKLNHFHIFDFPFDQSNGFNLNDIQPGLQDIALKYKTDLNLKQKINQLGELYLATGTVLIQGDFYPGSWLKVENEIKIIDPEFGYLGKPEFDLGVFMAHLYMAKKSELAEIIIKNYSNKIDLKLVYSFAGVEIMRRILGVAQLPLSLNLIEKQEVLEKAYSFIEKYEI
jgi:5-methylthioribose kinase